MSSWCDEGELTPETAPPDATRSTHSHYMDGFWRGIPDSLLVELTQIWRVHQWVQMRFEVTQMTWGLLLVALTTAPGLILLTPLDLQGVGLTL